jgi:hypothetical protein
LADLIERNTELQSRLDRASMALGMQDLNCLRDALNLQQPLGEVPPIAGAPPVSEPRTFLSEPAKVRSLPKPNGIRSDDELPIAARPLLRPGQSVYDMPVADVGTAADRFDFLGR